MDQRRIARSAIAAAHRKPMGFQKVCGRGILVDAICYMAMALCREHLWEQPLPVPWSRPCQIVLMPPCRSAGVTTQPRAHWCRHLYAREYFKTMARLFLLSACTYTVFLQ